MLVVVNQPHTEGFRIVGSIPKDVLDFVERRYSRESISIMDDDSDELIDPTEMDFYKEMKASETPGGNLRFYRRLVGMTQQELAEKLGMSKHHISDMENGRRAISKKTAKELATLFDTSVERFI